MNLFESFRIALDMLRLHKMRAFLTMLGVIIGVMSVTLISMISNGFQHYITYEFKKLGSDSIWIAYDGGGGRRSERNAMISGMQYEDLELLLNQCTTLDIASASLQMGAQKISYLDRSISDPSVSGVDEYADDMGNVPLVSGRQISEADLDNRANVCLIGLDIRDKLFGNEDPIGQMLTFPGITLQVVGVMENVEIMGQNNKKEVWVPLTTAQDKWIGGDQISYITARPKPGISTDSAMDDVWRVLMAKSGNKKVYRVDSRESVTNIFGNILGVAGAILGGVAALSLLVGGIGIMNIMLVSVTERTREVGLRKAVGAKRGSVLMQFLVEASMLSVIGGFIGMGFAWILGLGITAITAAISIPSKGGLQMVFPLEAAITSTVISAIIGVVFGLYPAARASSLSPIEALRTE
ncbi:MAG: ABC transporter permease [Fimbriimonadaceae bacterium]|nr:MAG: ABC transporter permease [Fimbriimonadaceae bacterium]